MSTLKVNTLTDTAATKSVPIEDVVNGTARAWVNFNGTFGTSPFTIANGGIRAAYNVSSVTDNGTGIYTVNFTTALSDANYAGVVTTSTKGSTDTYGATCQTGSVTTTYGPHSTTQLGINTATGGGSLIDPETVQVAIFR